MIADQRRRDVHAVEDVADVVQHAGGDFGHPRLPRCREQSLVQLLAFGLGAFLIAEVAQEGAEAEVITAA